MTMYKKLLFLPLFAGMTSSLYIGCSSSGDGGGGAVTNSTVSGRLSTLTVSAASEIEPLSGTKTITHVMAVAASTSNPQRFVAAVASDGSFTLGVNSGKPYVIVFVSQDGVQTGPNMIVSVVRVSANQLDTLPLAQAGNVSLGNVSVDSATQTSTASANVSELLSALGVTSGEASYIGSVDDLALRLANPDVDGNGVIDATEGKVFSMDWHVRADTRLGGSALRLSDVENAFAAESSVTLNWTLGSAYAVYPTSYDNVVYPQNPGVSTTLQNGGAFDSGATMVAPTSMSGNTFGDSRQWGPDYNMGSQELGASDVSSTFQYTLGSPSKRLTFSNVRTQLKTSLNSNGTLLPFVRVNTSADVVTGIGYKWMKKSGSSWVDATENEVRLIAQDSGAYLVLYTERGSVQRSLDFSIPVSPVTGTIAIGDTVYYSNQNVINPNSVSLTSICNVALSYDDNLGLRLFAGAPSPNMGVTVCN